MHNVKKTPASEAQLATRAKERELKLKAFVEARDLIFQRRHKNKLDEKLLELTGEVLEKQPDIYTFWNIRRDVIACLKQRGEEENDAEYEQRLQSIYEKELKLTFKCITANPKSYSSWYHRSWVLQEQPRPDLKAELALCEKSLSYVDCRNFHCWNHRRVVAALAEMDSDEELEFSNRLIKLNPSNYSAWHYRGTLLQKRQKDTDATRLLNDEVVASELKTVKDVCAYNSEDQTAWTYCRWLCEAMCTKVEPSLVLVCAQFKEIYTVELTFSQAITRADALTFIQSDFSSLTLQKFSKFGSPGHKHEVAYQWHLKVESDSLNLKFNDDFVRLDATKQFNAEYLQEFYSLRSKCKTEESQKALAGVVEMCEGLMQEEEDIPWEVLMLARLLPLLNGLNSETVRRAQELLAKTQQLDPQRRNLYADMSERLDRVRSLSSVGSDELPETLYEYFKLEKGLS